MNAINVRRIFTGGLLVGFLLNVSQMVLHRSALISFWDALLGVTFGMSESIWMILANFLLGITTVWLYVIMRDRFGPGPKTAIMTGFMIWVFVALIPGMAALGIGYLPWPIVWVMLLWRFFELPIIIMAGAAPYREGDTHLQGEKAG
ncbi:hypothetical protein KQI63_00040 [bacterium]|nr:hypothetical protein [bacterium]